MKDNLKIEKFIFNDFEQNTYLLYDIHSLEAVIIDPGNSNDFENDEIERYIKDNNLKLTKIIITHGHIDHIFGIAFLKEIFNPVLYFPFSDLPLLQNVRLQAEMIGVPAPKTIEPDFDLHQLKKISFNDSDIEVIGTPGHSPGGTSLLIKDIKTLFSGDTIFFESIGRTDLWGGDYNILIKSIKEKIFTLDEDIKILPGHGPATTVLHEKLHNPFINQ